MDGLYVRQDKQRHNSFCAMFLPKKAVNNVSKIKVLQANPQDASADTNDVVLMNRKSTADSTTLGHRSAHNTIII